MSIKATINPAQKTYNTLADLLSNNTFVGFETGANRYMVVGSGDAKGLAVRPMGTWTSVRDQKITQGNYYIFETASDLFDWMKG